MAYEGHQITIPGAVAGADLSAAANAFKFVKWGTAPAVVLCSAVTDIPCGVLQAPAPTSALGQPVQVVALGCTKVQGDGTATVGALIGPDTNGRAVTNVWGTDKTAFIAGYVLNRDAAGAAGSLLTAMINCINPPKAVLSA
jgi:hypothetical protein